MADGFSLNIDDKFLRTLERADVLMSQIAKTSEDASKRTIQAISDVNNNALKPFIENLNGIRKALSTKADPIVFKEINNQAAQSIDKVNSFVAILNKITTSDSGKTKNSAISKINEELDVAVRKLSDVQQKLNFYANGEGKKAIGFVDTNALQKEANFLMARIDALEKEKQTQIELSRIRMSYAQTQEKLDNAWLSMERAKISALKEEASVTNALVKTRSSRIVAQREEQQRMYEKLFHDAIAKQYSQMWDDAEKMLAKKQKLESENYEIWLRQKAREVEEHRRAEDSKTQATQNAIKQQLEAMALNANRERAAIENQRRLEQEATQRVNQQIQARYTYTSETERMYAQMFDRIAEKEKAKQDEARRYEQSLYEDNLVKYRKMKQDQANVDKHYHDIRQRQYEEMFRAIERNEKRQRQIDQKYGDSSKGALNYANRLYSDKGVMSVQKMETALSKLRDAQTRINLSTEDGRKKYDEIGKMIQKIERDMRRLTDSQDKFNKGQSRLLNTTDQLQRKLALLFSISAIQGYLDKLVSVRKEFELQHKSLQVLIRDKDQADKLWQQTIDLAVKSPFRIKELVGYTKQLAAYRIETSKLHETTKMLSDVSAGLGVDMQRIILAFGQVRAANFLRGTELRQFTEAGIPMLDELAQLFTELEGRAVSAGDVFERISKRMVSFRDVEEVFKRMTSESGVFYNMQEEQSKTLYGMISNLHDSIDLMLNDIGRSNDGTIKDMVSLVRDLVDNWRAFATLLKQVGVGLAAMNIVKFVQGWAAASTALGAADITMRGVAGTAGKLRLALVGLGNTLKAHPILLIGGIIASAGHALWEYIEAIDAANEKYDEMSRREVRQLDRLKELKEKTEEYNEVIKDAQKTEEQRNQAQLENDRILGEIKSKYPDLLPLIEKQKDGTIDLTNAIEEQNRKLIENIALQQKAKGGFFQETLDENYKEAIDAYNKLQTSILDFQIVASKAQAKLDAASHPQHGMDGLREEDIKRFSELLYNIRQAKDFSQLKEAYQALIDEIRVSGKEVTKQVPLLGMFANAWLDVTGASRDYRQSQEDLMDNFKNQQEYIEYGINEAYKRGYKKAFKTHGIHDDALIAGRLAAGEWIEGFLDNFGIVDKTIREWAKKVIPEMLPEISVMYPQKKEIEEQLQAWQESYNRLFKGYAGFVKIAQSNTKQDDVIKIINEQIKETEELIKRINNAGGINTTLTGGAYEGQDLAALNTELRELKEQQKWFGEESKKNSKKGTENVNKQISLIKEMHKQYKELNKEFDDTVSKEKVMTSYAEAFKEIFDEAGLSMYGRVLDDKAIANLKESGKVSEDVVKKIEELSSKGTHIRSFSEDFISSIKYAEGFIEKAKDIGDGKWTYGYGETKGVSQGDTITEEQADMRLRIRLTNDFAASLNNVLDANKDIIVTQEQYNSLLDLTYQGGGGAVKRLFEYAKNEEKAVAHINSIYEKVKKVFGENEAERFGEAFVNKFKEAESVYDRMAMLLQTMNLTVKGGQISERLYGGMQKRSDERSALFATGKEVSDIIRQASVEISQINIDSAKGVVETLKKLIPYAKSIGDKALEPLLKAIAEVESEIELEPKIAERQSIEDQIEEMFGNYEISLELQKMNIPSDLAEKLFDLKSIDLSDLRDEALNIFGFDKGLSNKEIFDSDKFKSMAEEQKKIIKDTLTKVSEMEEKEYKERAKKYVKYLIKAQGERVKIKMDEVRQLNEIETLGFDESQKEMARRAIQEESKKQLNKLEWEEFKDSGMYVRLFEDLEYASTEALTRMREKLSLLKTQLSNLDADDLKHLYSQINKLEDELNKRNPYKVLITGVDDYIKAVKESKRVEDEIFKRNIATDVLKKKEVEKSEELAKEQELYKEMSKNKNVTKDELNAQAQKVSFLNMQFATTKAQLAAEEKLTKELEEQLDKLTRTRKSFTGGMQEIGSDISEAANALPNIASELENVFGTMDAGTRDTIESIATIGSGVGDAIQGFASSNYIQAISGIAKALGGIFAIGDKKKERQIQREIELVETLDRSYQKLEKAIDSAYSINTLQESGKAARKNIEEQIAAHKRMIALEENKKKTDHERIKEWERAIEDLTEQKAELDKQLISSATSGIMDDVLSASREFTDAWLEAFNETGNGLKGLESNFKETMLEMVKQQAAMLISNTYINKWKEQLAQYINPDDLELTTSEAKQWINSVTSSLPQLNNALERYFEAMKNAGVDLGGGTSGELSGLQRGIQEIQESTAQEISAYLNSIRFFVAEQTNYLQSIASAYTDNSLPNPMLAELKTQTEMIRAIRDMFSGVIRNGHPTYGGSFIKVSL